jgi:RNA polymerase sigma factor (sigma-70 family)
LINVSAKIIKDIVQKAFLNAFRNIMNFRGEGTLSAWLFTIVNRAAIDWLDEEGRHEHKDIDAQDEDTPGDEKISDPSAKIAQNDSEDYICLKQLIARLEKEGKTNLSECLQAYIWKSLDYPQDEIAPKIGRTYQATRQFMSTCIKKLRQYSPFQECQDIFLKMCFEDLERNTSDTELKRCLQVYLLKLQEPTDIRKIAKEIGKTVKDTKIELYDCGKRLMQEPSLQEKCREWFRQEMFQQCGDIFLPICLERELERGNFDTKLIGCLRAHILKSQGKSVKEIAKQIGKNTDETKIYLEECRKMLVQEPSIQKECGEWLSDPEWNEETGKK